MREKRTIQIAEATEITKEVVQHWFLSLNAEGEDYPVGTVVLPQWVLARIQFLYKFPALDGDFLFGARLVVGPSPTEVMLLAWQEGDPEDLILCDERAFLKRYELQMAENPKA